MHAIIGYFFNSYKYLYKKGLEKMIYGYIRVSTDHQTVENQRFEIENYCKNNKLSIDKWIEETISSRVQLKDRKLGKLLKHLKKGDILISSELSRLGRNLLQVMGILQHCLEKECQIWTIKENYKLGADLQSKVLAFAFALSAEIERQLISQRTKESLNRIKAEGKHLGRPFGFKCAFKKLKEDKQKIIDLYKSGMSKSQLGRMYKVSRTTIKRLLQTERIN